MTKTQLEILKELGADGTVEPSVKHVRMYRGDRRRDAVKALEALDLVRPVESVDGDEYYVLTTVWVMLGRPTSVYSPAWYREVAKCVWKRAA